MIGPIIDSGCLLAGGLAGAYSSHLVPKRIKESLPPIFGVVTLCMGMTLVNKVAAMPVVVAALLLGTLLGELFFAERLLSAIIKKLLLATRRRDMPVDEATVLSLVTLVSAFCFGSMGIFGAVTEAITGKPDILLAKAVLDIFSGLLFGAVFGGIVGCIALPQFAVLTLCYLCGNFCAPFMTPPPAGRLHRLRRGHLCGHGPADVRHPHVSGHQHAARPAPCAASFPALAAYFRRMSVLPRQKAYVRRRHSAVRPNVSE